MSLQANSLVFERGQARLLDGVNATFAAGRVSAIVGPNGAGKTTLLRLLSGELKPSCGSVLCNETPLASVSLEERAHLRAVMTQGSHIVFDFSVEEVLHMGWVQSSGPPLKEALEHIVHRCGIQNLLGRRFNTLSGGEQQRVQFARALLQLSPLEPATQPRFLLLDEPTASLDVAHELLVLSLAREATGAQIGMVVVLHDLNLAARFADEIFLLRRGALVRHGPPAEVLEAQLLSQVYATPMLVEHHETLQRITVHTN